LSMMKNIIIGTTAYNLNDIGVNMIRLVLCDDSPVFLERLRSEIQAIQKEEKIFFAISTFSCAEEISPSLLASADAFFLDIDFAGAGYTGIDLARKIREVNQFGVIVFATNYIEYAPAGYEVQAFRYLLKSEIPLKLRSCLKQVVEEIQNIQETVLLKCSGKSIPFSLTDVLYLEAQDHNVVVYVQPPKSQDSKEYRLYTTLSNLEEQLINKGFLRIQKSYLVNMRRIQKLQCTGAMLDTGLLLKVSQKTYAEQKKKYLLWEGGV